MTGITVVQPSLAQLPTVSHRLPAPPVLRCTGAAPLPTSLTNFDVSRCPAQIFTHTMDILSFIFPSPRRILDYARSFSGVRWSMGLAAKRRGRRGKWGSR